MTTNPKDIELKLYKALKKECEHLAKEDLVTTNPKDLEGNKKPQLSLVPPSVLIHLANAFKEGAQKYGAYNWRKNKVQSMVYLDAALRHIMATIDGEDIDPESGKHHLDGALASLAVYIDAMETGNLIDTRPAKGVAGDLIRKTVSKVQCWDKVDLSLTDPNKPFEQQNCTGYIHK